MKKTKGCSTLKRLVVSSGSANGKVLLASATTALEAEKNTKVFQI